MELPENLKLLYRHWPNHTERSNEGEVISVISDDLLADSLITFVDERMRIWQKRQMGHMAPYTSDKILQTYRFCNILRELDRQTIEYHEMLNPLRGNFSLWLLNMFYARMVARPETLRAVGLLSFDQDENDRLRARLMQHPRPTYGVPYVFAISAIMRSETPTRELFITQHLPRVIKEVASEIERWDKLSVQEGVKRVVSIFGFNLSFLWTEVLIDVAYQYPEYVDLFALFPIGPGSKPTLMRIDASQDSSELVVKLASLHVRSGLLYDNRQIVLSAENWEGIGCEFRKYTNLSQGKGRRRLYKSESD